MAIDLPPLPPSTQTPEEGTPKMKRMTVEQLLKWAFCEELPKAGSGGSGEAVRSAWVSIESFVQLLTKVDDNRYGVVPLLDSEAGDPHPDALIVFDAVAGLEKYSACIPHDWNPMPEIMAYPKQAELCLRAARFGIENANSSIFNLVRKHAILGGVPEWEGDVPELVPVCNESGQPIWFQMRMEQALDENGQPIERKFETADGWNRNTKAPKAGAYQKHYLDPDPVMTLIGRGEYLIWRSAMETIGMEVAGRLRDHAVIQCDRPWSPWEKGVATDWKGPRVLTALAKNS